MRPIDADAMIDRLKEWDTKDKTDKALFNFTLNRINEQPTIHPVPHGHWIHDGLDIPHGVDWMHCSECGKRDKYCPATMTNYCPNCGAKMDGEEDG